MQPLGKGKVRLRPDCTPTRLYKCKMIPTAELPTVFD
jgi:hypothetical protein